MNREELIAYIRKNDEFYKSFDLSRHSIEELRRIKELIEAIKAIEEKDKYGK